MEANFTETVGTSHLDQVRETTPTSGDPPFCVFEQRSQATRTVSLSGNDRFGWQKMRALLVLIEGDWRRRVSRLGRTNKNTKVGKTMSQHNNKIGGGNCE